MHLRPCTGVQDPKHPQVYRFPPSFHCPRQNAHANSIGNSENDATQLDVTQLVGDDPTFVRLEGDHFCHARYTN